MQIKIPKAMLDLPKQEREEILGVVSQALRLPAVRTVHTVQGDEHNIWAHNSEPLLAEAENELYEELMIPWSETIADVIVALDLPTEGVTLEKAYTPAYEEYFDLLKSKEGKKRDIRDIIQATKEKRDKFLQHIKKSGEPWTKKQLKKLDDILRRKVPNLSEIAERYAVRAGFIAKVRSEVDKEAIDNASLFVDRFPTTITEAEHEGIVLTVQQQEKAKAEGRKVTILPLTSQEKRSVEHADLSCAEKITEIAERHRAGVKQLVIRAQKERWEPQKLAQELFDLFGDQNRDWRRVALTELAMASNDAYLAGCTEGDTVIGMGAENACKKCKEFLIGKSFTVKAEPPEKDTFHSDMMTVWAGKSNYGRRVAEYVPAIPLHPNCRCRYHKISKFYKMVNGELVRKTTAEMIQEERARRGLPPDPNLKA